MLLPLPPCYRYIINNDEDTTITTNSNGKKISIIPGGPFTFRGIWAENGDGYCFDVGGEMWCYRFYGPLRTGDVITWSYVVKNIDTDEIIEEGEILQVYPLTL